MENETEQLQARINELEQENQRYKDGLNKCRAFKEKVTVMLEAQQSFFKSRQGSDLKKSIALEKEVRELINPKPMPQKAFFDESL